MMWLKKDKKNTQYPVAYTDKKKQKTTVTLHLFYTASHIPYSFSDPIVSLKLQ